jgi:hypothetical protein
VYIVPDLLHAIAYMCKSPYLSRFLFCGLLRLAAYCALSGVRVVSCGVRVAMIVRGAIAGFVAVILVVAVSTKSVPQFRHSLFGLSPILNKANCRYKAESKSGHHHDRSASTWGRTSAICAVAMSSRTAWAVSISAVPGGMLARECTFRAVW